MALPSILKTKPPRFEFVIFSVAEVKQKFARSWGEKKTFWGMPHQDDIVVVAVFCIFVFRIDRQIDNSWCCLSVCYVAVSTLFVVKCFVVVGNQRSGNLKTKMFVGVFGGLRRKTEPEKREVSGVSLRVFPCRSA